MVLGQHHLVMVIGDIKLVLEYQESVDKKSFLYSCYVGITHEK